MQDQFEIRPARPQDVDAIQSCATEAFQQYVAAIGKKPAPMVADFAALIDAGHVYVAVQSPDRSLDQPPGNLLGYIVFFRSDTVVELENIAVRPSATGRGVGKALIQFCEDSARQGGAQAVALYTNAKMVENLAIYPHLGYQEIARRREDGFDRVFFKKTL
ncbi:GNAT family N-acetyltransferase [Epibacterium sp. SM1979]|uniref:GNAT family N-acetyltransferase n=1 Tax=Tritonibacter litoralis TaxID=2662264 RepID=A0A843YEG7_9RHOB|nr:N-acetyltransferase [Tritonibacter litoralis]MQQ07702.1 GNAT family N-acetyltransferase [Tritonibacter litoralis]